MSNMSSNIETFAPPNDKVTGNSEDSSVSSQKVPTKATGSSDRFVPLKEFLDKFPLPRVVRIEDGGCRPILLYKQQQRCLRVTATLLMHRYRHDIKVGPEIVIPEGYPGWFSIVTNDNHTGSARIYRKIGALMRAGVPAFLLAKPLRGYSLTHSKIENGNLKAHYSKTTVRAGEVLRLAAVFQDTRRAPITPGITSVTSDSSEMKNSRLSKRDQYAQFLDSRGHELFVPLSSRCELYAICQSGSLNTESDAVLYRVHQLVKRELPLRVRLIAGPLPIPMPRNYSGLMQLENATHGPIVLGCALPIIPERPIPSYAVPELFELVPTAPGAPRVKRTRLGCPSESRLLALPKMQKLFSACRSALDQRATEPRIAPLKLINNDHQSRESHPKEIKSELEPKPLLKSLKDSLEHIKKSTICDRPHARNFGNSNNQSFLERLTKITHSNKSRNPAKKSASFTFTVRPEIGMKVVDRYGSLESDTNALTSNNFNDNALRQFVYRSISTSALEIQTKTGSNFFYSKVSDKSVTQRSSASSLKAEDIYTEICDPSNINSKENFYPSEIDLSKSKACTRSKDREYMNLASHSKIGVSNTTIEEDNIYNTVILT